jgi:hypothetical protein
MDGKESQTLSTLLVSVEALRNAQAAADRRAEELAQRYGVAVHAVL